jgi:hypothetical protein
MRIWFALIVAPLLALGDQAVAFALVRSACTHQSTAPLHACHGLFLALTTVSAFAAWKGWRETALIPTKDGDATLQRHFLAGVAMKVAALSAAAIAAMWIATWMISSCIA